MAFHGEYREIVPDERMVSTEVYEGNPGEGTLNTASFSDAGDGARLEILVDCPSREVRDAIIDSGMEGGMQEAMDRLEEVALSFA